MGKAKFESLSRWRVQDLAQLCKRFHGRLADLQRAKRDEVPRNVGNSDHELHRRDLGGLIRMVLEERSKEFLGHLLGSGFDEQRVKVRQGIAVPYSATIFACCFAGNHSGIVT
jgi:hypothetical protein